jgi:hypothetical protein
MRNSSGSTRAASKRCHEMSSSVHDPIACAHPHADLTVHGNIQMRRAGIKKRDSGFFGKIPPIVQNRPRRIHQSQTDST